MGQGTIAILLHLMSDWQMNLNLTRSILGLLLLCVAGMFAFVAALANEPAAQKTATGKTGNVFRDCPDCPEMVMLPQGRFVMGALPGEEERENVMDYFRGHSVPQHLVTIRYRLAIAKFDVTRDEYAQFVADTNRPDPDSCYGPDGSGRESDKKGANWHSPGFPQTGKDPVVCVNWDDAQAYVAWLGAKAGHVYRLPTEAEWEYAARAGTTTARYGSDRPAELCCYINHADLDFSELHPHESGVNRECRDGFAFTSPVGSFPRTNSASTTCLAMSGNGLEIAGTTTIRVRSPTVVLGKAGSVVGALCAAAPIAIFRGSSARPSATGPNRQAGTTAAGSAWLEHCHEFPFVLVRFDHAASCDR